MYFNLYVLSHISSATQKLFGSVTSQMISEAIAEQGFTVDKKEIEIPNPIKSLGKFVVFVRLGPELEAKIKIKVSAEK